MASSSEKRIEMGSKEVLLGAAAWASGMDLGFSLKGSPCGRVLDQAAAGLAFTASLHVAPCCDLCPKDVK